ncbi:MAG: hypothetical protein IKA63_01230 [Clostridia bacterium]|nr:hypothetical protein [Clostridia bacterium]
MAKYGSEAYDLSLFEPKKAKITPLHGKKATKAEKKRARIQKLLNTVVTALVSCGVLLVITLMITSQVQLTEMNNAITRKESELSEMLGEIKRLEGELAAQTSAQSIEEYAESVGLRQTESGQIDYISVTVPDVEKEPEPSFWATVWGAIQAWIG